MKWISLNDGRFYSKLRAHQIWLLLLDPSFPYDEKEILHRVAQGDESAFSILFYRYFARLHPFIFKFTRSQTDSEEVLQEVFIRIWMNRDKLDEVLDPDAWIFTIATNECYKFLRKQATRQQHLQSASQDTPSQDNDQSTLHSIHLREINRVIAAAVSQLPAQRKRIYQMSREEGLKIPEIATALRLSPNTVKNALVSALQFIRSYLADRGHNL